jgi:hypothetical protein
MSVGVFTLKANSIKTGSTNFNTFGSGASMQARLADNDSGGASGITSKGTSAGLYTVVGFLGSSVSLASDEYIESVRFVTRMSRPSAGSVSLAVGWQTSNFSSLTTYTGTASSSTWIYGPWIGIAPVSNGRWDYVYTGTRIFDNVSVKVIDNKSGANVSSINEVWIEYRIAKFPTVDITAPAGTLSSTSQPTLTWDYSANSTATAAPTNKVVASNVATLTFAAQTPFAVGDPVVVSGVDASGTSTPGVYDGTRTITAVSVAAPWTVTFTVPTATSTTSLTNTGSPLVTWSSSLDQSQYQFMIVKAAVVTNKELTSNVAKLTFSANHGYSVGDRVWVALNSADAVFDGSYTISATTANTISYARTNANVSVVSSAGFVAREPNDLASNPIVFGNDYKAAAWVTAYNTSLQADAVTGTEKTITPPVSLANNTSYRIYGKVTKNPGAGVATLARASQGAANGFTVEDFSIAITPPEAPIITASFNSGSNKVALTVSSRVNVLSETDSTCESGIGTWNAEANATGLASSSTNGSSVGTNALRFQATTTADSIVRTGNYAVEAGELIRAVADIKTPTTSGKTTRVDIAWYAADGTTLLSTSTGTGGTNSNITAFFTRTCDATAPAGAAFARVKAIVVAPTASDFIAVDKIGLWPDQSGSWSIGGYSGWSTKLERSDDSGTTWSTVLNGGALATRTSQSATLDDYTAPRGVTVQYRATTTVLNATGGTIASSISNVPTASITNDGLWWFKVLADPTRNVGGVKIRNGFTESVEEQSGQFWPVGRTRPVVVSSGIGGRNGNYPWLTTSVAEFTNLAKVLEYAGTVLVQDPTGGQKYVRFTSRSWSTVGTATRPLREGSVDYVEVASP